MRNDARDFADRLYARIPAQYRVYDEERGRPLFALATVIAEQVANLRNDLDRLWDNFFIETCDDWVVPYLGALVGANLVQVPIGRGNRLEVRGTIDWRRRRGTVSMLREVVAATSGWPCDVTEFFQHLGWSQNMNHRRLDHPLTPDLRSAWPLALLGHANDPFAHAADFRGARDLEQPRIGPGLTTPGIPAWGTPGRYQIPNLGFFVRRLQTFALHGVTPASAAVASPPSSPPAPAAFTFDPLLRNTPLFEEESGAAITRAAFDHDPWQTFGRDVAVRHRGILLAAASAPQVSLTSSLAPFTFGGRSNVSLHPTRGMGLVEPRELELGGAYFVITAYANAVKLGTLSTLHAAAHHPGAFQAGAASSGPLSITVTLGNGSSAARFPGAVVAIRATPDGFLRDTDALYVYLPPLFLQYGNDPISQEPRDSKTFFVADDGSTYTLASLDSSTLVRESEGSVYPPCALTSSTATVTEFAELARKGEAIVVVDKARLAGVSAVIRTGAGGIATVHQNGTDHPDLDAPASWDPFTYAPMKQQAPDVELRVRIELISGTEMPPCELIVTNRHGQSLLIYLPKLENVASGGQDLVVGSDGSTHFAAGGLARASAGQVLPMVDEWPLRQRRPVGINLCDFSRQALLQYGELGIDPELGRWALAPADPLVGAGGFTVDYVEAFSAPIGARTYDRLLGEDKPATRVVSRTGDADTTLPETPVHATLFAAIVASSAGDVIEIADSATYIEPAPIDIAHSLVIRAAAGERPCLAFPVAAGPLGTNFRVTSPIDSLELNGMLISGGALRVSLNAKVQRLKVLACTLDPLASQPSLVADDFIADSETTYLVCRSITGALRVGTAPALVIADSIVDRQGGLAIAGLPIAAGELADVPAAAAAGRVQLERVTLLGHLRCDILNASESILDESAFVDDQQSGCVRYCRYEPGSVLPRRFECVPDEGTLRNARAGVRAVAPLFNSRRAYRCDYAQLAFRSAPEIETASEERSEIGAFARIRNPIRLGNARTKLREFMPAGLTAVFIAET